MSDSSAPLDSQWFAELRPFLESDVDWLQHHWRIGDEEKQRFLENDVENPRSEIVDPNPQVIAEYQEAAVALKSKVEQDTVAPSSVRTLYMQRIDRQLTMFELCKASMQQDDNRFHELSVELYGRPKKKFTNYLVHRVRGLLEAHENTPHQDAHRHLRRIFAKLEVADTPFSNTVLPPVQEDGGGVLSAQEIKQVFETWLTKYGLSEWSVEIDDTGTRTRFAAGTHNKTVFVPNDAALSHRPHPLTQTRVEALAEHEIGVHARRVDEGERQPLQLLSLGLPQYKSGEEGLATYMQQQREGATEFYGFDRYLAIALATGFDGKPRDFRGSFTVLKQYYLLILDDDKTVHERAAHAAYELCVRMFRGTTGTTSGAVFTRDLIYLRGNVGIWNLLAAEPDILPELFVGKFNPLREAHRTALAELNIISATEAERDQTKT